MFEDIHNRLFGSKIKTLAKLCCYFCLIVGFLCAFWGALSLAFGNVSEAYLSSKRRLDSGYSWHGKQLAPVWIWGTDRKSFFCC